MKLMNNDATMMVYPTFVEFAAKIQHFFVMQA